jgi:hypothetical protein
MAKQTKLEDLAKAGAKRVRTSVKNTKIKNAKPKPGDQTKLDLKRGGGKFSYGRNSKKK